MQSIEMKWKCLRWRKRFGGDRSEIEIPMKSEWEMNGVVTRRAFVKPWLVRREEEEKHWCC